LNVYNIISSLIGVMIGSILSWFFNRWLNKNKLKTEIQIKVVDEISSKILRLREQLYEEYKLINDFNSYLLIYIQNISQNKDSSYKKVESLYDDIWDKKDVLISEFDEFFIFLEIKEIVIKEFSRDVSELDKRFWDFIFSLEDFNDLYINDIFKSEITELIEELLPAKDFNGIELAFQNQFKSIYNAYKDLLIKLNVFNEALLNKVYGKIFNKKIDKKIFEVPAGKLEPIERIYTLEKAKQIYKQHRIKKVFFD